MSILPHVPPRHHRGAEGDGPAAELLVDDVLTGTAGGDWFLVAARRPIIDLSSGDAVLDVTEA